MPQQYTVEELGARVRSRNPGVFGSFSDKQIGDRVLQRKPELRNMISIAETAPKEPQTTKPLIEKLARGVTNIAGGTKIGEALGAIGANLSSPKEIDYGGQVGKVATPKAVGPSGLQVAGDAAQLGLTLGTLGTGSAVGAGTKFGTQLAKNKVLSFGKNLIPRAIETAGLGTAYQAASNIANDRKIGTGLGTAALVGGAVPVLGTGLSKVRRLLGEGLESTGEQILTKKIKPSKRDVESGFDIKNLTKYNLGSDLEDIISNGQTKLRELSKLVKTSVKSSKENVDLMEVLAKAENKLSTKGASNFGDNKAVRRVLNSLVEEVIEISPKGVVDLADAQLIKQAVGTKGSWVNKMVDPDANAAEEVYNTFYDLLKKQIEQKTPKGVVAGLNKQMSEIIPILNAAQRRLPVEQRNAALSLGDLIAGFGGLATLGPKGLAIVGAKKAMESGKTAIASIKLGQKLQQVKPSLTGLGKRVFGK